MQGMDVHEAGLVFVDPTAYADEDRFHAACALLRREDPIHWVEAPGFNPFYVVTRHADVMEIETHHNEFHNAPRPILQFKEFDDIVEQQGDLLRTLIHMDEPDHRLHRAVTADWFLPKSLARYEERMRVLSKRFVDHLASLGGECDFVTDVAMQYPLHGILAIMGLPESDFPRMLQLTQEIFGANDPEEARSTDITALLQTLGDFFLYYYNLTSERQANPTEDLASVIANAQIEGAPMGDMERISYYIIVATAGHDTTASSIGGGLLALAQHPDQLARLQADLSLLPTAVDEMIRWVTPVKHFMRNATVDYEVNGVTIKEGQSVLLSYPSANRDETVFADPFHFDVGRTPNRHMAFGFGAHFCLGAQFARMEMRALFAELLPRLKHFEIVGQPESTKTLFVGGLKHLPIRYELT
jgi:cytochrome P450